MEKLEYIILHWVFGISLTFIKPAGYHDISRIYPQNPSEMFWNDMVFLQKNQREKKQKKQKQNGQSQKQRRNVDEPIAIHTGDQSHLYRTGEWKWQLDLLTTKTT